MPRLYGRHMKIIISFIIGIFLASNAWAASQEATVRQANQLFKEKKWDSAVDLYLNALEQEQHADIVQYDLGTTFYKKGNYDQAIEHLKKAVSDKNKDLSAKATYNMGNAFYQQARLLEKDKLDDAIASMQKSIDNYSQTLRTLPKDKDAKFNQDLAEKELERLKKKKEEQSKKQPDQKDQKDQKQQKQDQNQSSKDKQQEKQDQNKSSQDSSSQEEKDKQQAEEEAKDQAQKNAEQQQQEAQQKQAEQGSKEKAQEGQQQEAAQEGKKLSVEEQQAKEMLAEYERDDAPKGLLNFVDRRKGESHVERDW